MFDDVVDPPSNSFDRAGEGGIGVLGDCLSHPTILLIGNFEDTLLSSVEDFEGAASWELLVVVKEANVSKTELHSACCSALGAIDSDQSWSGILSNSEEVVESNDAKITNGLALGALGGIPRLEALFWDCQWECKLGHCWFVFSSVAFDEPCHWDNVHFICFVEWGLLSTQLECLANGCKRVNNGLSFNCSSSAVET